MSRDVFAELADPTLVALRLDGDTWPRGVLRERLIPDAWMGLSETRDGRRRYVPAGDDPRPERDSLVTLVRNRAIVVPLELRGVSCAGGDLVDVSGEALVRWMPRVESLAPLASSLVDGRLTLERLAELVAREGADEALREHIRNAGIVELLERDQRDAFTPKLREALRRLSFENGLTVERVTLLKFRSDTHIKRVARQNAESAVVAKIDSRRRLEAASLAATRERLSGLGEILEKLKEAGARGGGRWSELLPALAPSERTRLLENLWRISERREKTTAIVAVSGDSLFWINPQNPATPARRSAALSDLGPLRSVAAVSDGRLLVGAALGVWLLDAHEGRVIQRFATPGVSSARTGFNTVTLGPDERVYATSSQLGCWAWSIAGGESERILAPDGGAPRAIRAITVTDDGRLFFAADDCVHVYRPGADEPLSTLGCADDMIHALAIVDQRLYVGVEDGRLLRTELDQPDAWVTVQRFIDPIESVTTRHWDDLFEIIVAAGDQGVLAVYDEQSAVVPLVRANCPIRRAWASADLVVGLSAARDRLLAQRDDGGEAVEIPIARVSGRSIQDVALLTESAPPADTSAPA